MSKRKHVADELPNSRKSAKNYDYYDDFNQNKTVPQVLHAENGQFQVPVPQSHYPNSFFSFADGIKSDIVDLVDSSTKTISSIIFYPFSNITNTTMLPVNNSAPVYDKTLYGQAKRRSNQRDDEEDANDIKNAVISNDIQSLKPKVNKEKEIPLVASSKLTAADMKMRLPSTWNEKENAPVASFSTPMQTQTTRSSTGKSNATIPLNTPIVHTTTTTCSTTSSNKSNISNITASSASTNTSTSIATKTIPSSTTTHTSTSAASGTTANANSTSKSTGIKEGDNVIISKLMNCQLKLQVSMFNLLILRI